MSESGTTESYLNQLRLNAETLLGKSQGASAQEGNQDLDRLLHELHVTQIELEMQNAELLKGRDEAEEARLRYEELYNRYANLFELSPVAYVAFDPDGTIREANLNMAILVGLPKGELIGTPLTRFINHDDQDTFYLLKQDCRRTDGTHTAEIAMIHHGGRRFKAQIQLMLLPRRDSIGDEFRACILDRSESVRIADHIDFLQQCLEIAVRAPNSRQMLDDYVQKIKAYTRCSAVGIRLLKENGGIPYQSYDGFSKQFYEQESPLSLHTDQCLCIEVIKGHADPSKSFCTGFGSIYINGTSRFLATVPLEDRGRTRNACNAAGYESVALIPIYVENHISGLIHVADRRENMFPLRVVEILEQGAMRLGLALQRFSMNEQLRDAVEDLRELSSYLLRAREDEQRRISMELHDQTGQDLNVLKLRLKEIESGLPTDHEFLKQVCIGTRAYINTIIENVRRLIHNLTPPLLDSLGLPIAIQHLAQEFSGFCSMEIETRLTALETITDSDLKVGLFRIIQEAMNNACKHADATKMCISAIVRAEKLYVTIEDNGKGFSSSQKARSKRRSNGMGMPTMSLRARMLGGTLSIKSVPGNGTCITICLPMKTAREVS
jgi:PAS domain S-box-containing protein